MTQAPLPPRDRVELASSPALQAPVLTAAVRAMFAAAPAAPAAPVSTRGLTGAASGPHAVDVVTRVPSDRWGWIELLRDRDPHLEQRRFHPRQVIRDAEIVAAFGSATPPSGDALLMYAGDPPPGAPRRDTPVILVHGASKNAQFWWDPHEDGTDRGLPQALRDQGYRVYAVSYAHNQDDNRVWSQQLSNVIERVKTLEGTRQVDLVGHSKGGVPVRAYLSDFGDPWMTRYQGDVRRAVFVASPLGGIDYSFRHPSANYALYGSSDNPRLNAPISWDRMLAYGTWQDVSDVGFGAEGPDFWPGQRQLLARWDGVYAPSAFEPDVRSTYEGGHGLLSASRGIDAFIEESDAFMPRLRATPIDPRVEVALLAGNRPNIEGIANERDGASDGLLFVRSALEAPRGANVVAQQVFPLHHKAVVSEPAPQQWIADVLAPPSLPPLARGERDRVCEQAVADGERLRAEESARDAATGRSLLG